MENKRALFERRDKPAGGLRNGGMKIPTARSAQVAQAAVGMAKESPRDQVMAFSAILRSCTVGIIPGDIVGIAGDAELARLLDCCGTAEDVIATIRAEARKRLAEGVVVGGWALKPGFERETITNVQGVWGAVSAMATPGEFAGICSVAKTDLKKLVQSKTGMKGKELEDKLGSILAGNVETKATAPQLVKARPD